jgi:hypothetical protein
LPRRCSCLKRNFTGVAPKRCHSFYAGLDTELAELKTGAERLKKEIVVLCGEDATVVGEV